MKSCFLTVIVMMTMVNIYGVLTPDGPRYSSRHQRSHSWDPRLTRGDSNSVTTQPGAFQELSKAENVSYSDNLDPAGKRKDSNNGKHCCDQKKCSQCAQICCLAAATFAPLFIQLGII